MAELSFSTLFFRIYDRKIASGEITFSQTGINKALFTSLCQGEKVEISLEELEKICTGLKATDEERELLIAAYEG